MTEYDAIVVGGGIVGASTAFHLARAGEDVALFDRADEGRATDAGAGIVAPVSSARADEETWFRFALEAARDYPTLAERLAEAGVERTGYARQGMVRVALETDDVAAFDAATERIRARADEADAIVEAISSERARELVPALPDVERALYDPDVARVDGRRVTRAMRAAGRERGMDSREESVEEVLVADGTVEGVRTASGSYDASRVVIAGGAWSRRFGEQLGLEIPVAPQRGQIVHLRAGEFDARTDEWPIVGAFGDLYAVSWPDGRVAVGATREDGVGFAAHPTVAGVEEVLSGTMRILPGLSDAELLEVRVGLRPVSRDGRPIVGRVPGVEGAFVATGHGPTGLHLGPYTGRLVAELVGGDEPSTDVDLEAFAPDRFA